MTTTSSYESLSHSKWDCKYHVVFIPKGRKKAIYGKIRKYLGRAFHELAGQKDSRILEGHMSLDHVHMLVYSRYIVGWNLSFALDTENCLDALNKAIKLGVPDIINSDRGCQFTSDGWIISVVANGIKVSMDGKGRCKDNIYIERFWRTIVSVRATTSTNKCKIILLCAMLGGVLLKSLWLPVIRKQRFNIAL